MGCPEIALLFYISIIQPCMEYCCHVWTGVPSYYLDILDMLQKRICRTVGLTLAASLVPLAYHQNMSSFSFLWVTIWSGRTRSASFFMEVHSLSCYSGRLHDSVTIPRCYKSIFVNSVSPQIARFWDSPPIESFLLINDTNSLKSRINKHL